MTAAATQTMPRKTVYGLSSEQYHHAEPYSGYLSSTQLKMYRRSPAAFRHAMDEPPQPKTDALRFGSLFHSLMECAAEYSGQDALNSWTDDIAVFEPPVNPRTGEPYGAATKAYAEAYSDFVAGNATRTIATAAERDAVLGMGRSLLGGDSDTSRQVLRMLGWGRSEVSHFIERDGMKLKCRPDLETKKKIIDWKTTSEEDLTEESVNRLILRYGYHISAAMYQDIVHEVTGVWKPFYLVIVSKSAPYDCIMVDMANYVFRHFDDMDIVIPGPGAVEYRKLLELHRQCTQKGEWPGAETFVKPEGGLRIMQPMPPGWYSGRFVEEDGA